MATRGTEFLDDLRAFLGLSSPIEPLSVVRPGQNITGDQLELRNSKKIDICDAEHDQVRSVLQDQASKAATWIERYFLRSEDVSVSSRDHFVNGILRSWHVDPCVQRRSSQARAHAKLT
jgi:hypothetical protein